MTKHAGNKPNTTRNSPEDAPVLAVKRDGQVWRISKRSFFKSAVVGMAALAVPGCSDGTPKTDAENKKKDDDPPPVGADAVPPFQAGGVTYRVIKLADYNDRLPWAGKRVVVVAYLNSDLYFRSFDERGGIVANQHESRIADKASLAKMKSLVETVAARGRAEAAEQASFVDLFSKVTSSATAKGTEAPTTGRRLQGSEGRAESSGRRLQGSTASGRVTGRRLQGAEGRLEGDSAQRNLGPLVVNGERYTDAKIVETYKDGYTQVAHSGGTIVVKTDSLPEIVRMQMSHPVANPSPRPTAIPAAPRVESAPVVTPAPVEPRPSPPSTSYGGHYWRPN